MEQTGKRGYLTDQEVKDLMAKHGLRGPQGVSVIPGPDIPSPSDRRFMRIEEKLDRILALLEPTAAP